MAHRPRVVLDTNIYVSALAIPGGRADEAIRSAIEGRIELLVSPALLAELANVLTRKFDWERDRVLEACRAISELAIVVRPNTQLTVFEDDPDNRIMECAMAGRGDLIVTGDKQMLKKHSYENVRIISLDAFLKE